ncbi:hypothetical protein GCM10027425_17090 [Alteromonas gracilis]
MSSQRLRPWARLVATGVALAALSGCSVYNLPLPGGADTGDDPITVTAKFADVLDLVPQSSVRVDDVVVGKVTGIRLDGYVAVVDMEIENGLELVDDVEAEIRQTSLLGEKFVALNNPAEGGRGELSDGDVIPLDRSKRNPEVEEVLGALSLLLNGGGVGQLKTISEELNAALGGREADVRSLLTRLETFTGQLDRNRGTIVDAIESLNRLAVQVNRQEDSIKLALDELPSAVASIDSQREALVQTLRALDDLSDVGVRVIGASKEATINSLRDLGPVLDQLGRAQQDLPEALQVALTYPFVDEAVGRDPQVARNLHMGDFTNLAARLDLDLGNLPTPGLPNEVCTGIDVVQDRVIAEINRAVRDAVGQLDLPGGLDDRLIQRVVRTVQERLLDRVTCDNANQIIGQIPGAISDVLSGELQDLLEGATGAVRDELVATLCSLGILTGSQCAGTGGGGGSGGGLGGGLGDILGDIRIPGLPGLGRAGTGFDTTWEPGSVDVMNGPRGTAGEIGYNSTLGALLLQGVHR